MSNLYKAILNGIEQADATSTIKASARNLIAVEGIEKNDLFYLLHTFIQNNIVCEIESGINTEKEEIIEKISSVRTIKAAGALVTTVVESVSKVSEKGLLQCR